jgi:hypothetical protein
MLTKSPCRKLFPKFQKVHFDVSFSSTFFCFIAFSGVSQRWEFKNTTKNVLQKKSCRKVFPKNSTKNPKPTFSRIFFYHVFGRFSMRGVQKHDKKISENKSHPGPFSYSTFFFCRPLGNCAYLRRAPRFDFATRNQTLLRWPRSLFAGLGRANCCTGQRRCCCILSLSRLSC